MMHSIHIATFSHTWRMVGGSKAPISCNRLKKVAEVLINGCVYDIRVKLGGLHANCWIDVEVTLVTPDED